MMVQKSVIFSILLLASILLLIFAPSLSARNYLWTIESSLDMSIDTTTFEELTPDGAAETKEITISYTYERFARPQGFPLPNRKQPTAINLTISSPEWCTATLDNDAVTIPVESFLKRTTVNTTVTVTISATETAPAFNQGTITITADAQQNGNIKSSQASLSLTVIAAYESDIVVTTSNTTFSMMEGGSTNVTILVENKGNAKINTQFTTTNINENLTVLLPTSTTIAMGNQQEFIIEIIASDDLEDNLEDIVTIDVVTHAVDDPDQVTTTFSSSFDITVETENDSSDGLDLAPYVIGIAILGVVIILILSAVAYRRYR